MDTTETGSGAARSRRRSGSARTGLLGAVVGVGVAAGGLMLLTGGAGAQPTVDAGPAPGAVATQQIVADDGSVADLDLDGEFAEELGAHWACIDEVLGAAGIDVDDAEEAEPDLSDEQWESLDAGLEDCDEHLPAEWLEAEEAFEQCLIDNGLEFDDDGFDEEYDDDEFDGDEFDGDEFDDEFDGDFDVEPLVFFESEDGSTMVEFGDGDGEVTIAKVDGEIVIDAEGDVTTETFSWDDHDEAFEICESELPDGDE